MGVWPGGPNTKTIPQLIQEAIEPLQKRIEELEKKLRKPVDPEKVAIADILRHDELGLVSHQPDILLPITEILRVRDIHGTLYEINANELYPINSTEEINEYWQKATWMKGMK